MPADIVTLEDCASNYGVYEVVGSQGDVYTVTFSGSEGPAHCTCKAYKYSGAEMHCKHISQVYENACMYNAQWHDGNADPSARPTDFTYDIFSKNPCPVCAGMMVYVRRAV